MSKACSASLKAFLASPQAKLQADLYTISCTDGLVFYFTSFSSDVVYKGNRFTSLGPRLARGTIKWQQGLEVQELDIQLAVTVNDRANYTLGFQSAIINGAWDGAEAFVDRVWFNSPPRIPSELQPDGTYNADTAGRGGVNLFSGIVAEIDAGPLTIAVKLHSLTDLFNVMMPRHVFQPDCRWSLYDAGCTLNPTNFAVQGAVQPGSTASRVYLPDMNLPVGVPNSPGPLPPGWLSAGKITFTTGRLAGATRSIAFYQPSGTNTYETLLTRDGVLAYWPLSSNALDTGPFAYNGTVSASGVTFNQPSIITSASGGSAHFDGVLGSITFGGLPHPLALQRPLFGGFTLEFWVQPAVGRLQGIFDSSGGRSSIAGLRCYDYGTNVGAIEVVSRNPIITPLLVAQNIAHHVVVEVQGGLELLIYVDNYLQGSSPAANTMFLLGWNNFTLGFAGAALNPTPIEHFAGNLQGFAFYNYMLNETQISDHFVSGTTVPSTVPVAYADLLNPLPFAPQAGDLFIAHAGCDLSRNQCNNKFNNIINFGGQPTIPAPENVINLG